MKIPIISGYIDKKKKELERIRVFFTWSDSYGWMKSMPGREIFLQHYDENNPMKSLKNFKREYRKKYDNNGLVWTHFKFGVENFSNLSGEEKRRWIHKEVREERERKANKLLEKWCNDALPVLENIVMGEDLSGIRYHNHVKSIGGGYGVSIETVLGKNSTNDIDEYGENKGITQKDSHNIALGILKEGVLRAMKYPRYNGCYSENMERNRIVREIKKKCGRDLKKEVFKFREQRAKKFLSLPFQGMLPPSFFGGSTYS